MWPPSGVPAGCGQFEVDDRAGVKQRERGASHGLGGEVGGVEERGRDVERREADSADRHAVASVKPGGNGRGCNGDTLRACAGLDRDNGAGAFDKAGKHVSRILGQRVQAQGSSP